MNELICPICKLPLERNEKSLVCEKRHCFDIARSGYVNLSRTSGSGDDRDMVAARTAFLDSGAYRKFADRICELVPDTAKCIVDAGCGEGYYTTLLSKTHESAQVYGFDLSRSACDKGAKRAKSMGVGAFFAAASLFELPIADDSTDAVVNLFAPIAAGEFARILKPGGLLIIGAAGKRHLYELKSAVYDEVYENDGRLDLPGEPFELVSSETLAYDFLCEGDNIRALFSMTPYRFKTSRTDLAKLDALERLKIGARFDIFVYRKKD